MKVYCDFESVEISYDAVPDDCPVFVPEEPPSGCGMGFDYQELNMNNYEYYFQQNAKTFTKTIFKCKRCGVEKDDEKSRLCEDSKLDQR